MSVELVAGASRATIDASLGGRLASLVIGGRERILQTPANVPIDPALARGCWLMAPFVGRIENGTFEWEGRRIELARNAGRHAIHGSVFDAEWQVVQSDDASIHLTHVLDVARWPFRGSMAQRYTLAADSLELEADLVAEERMPAAMGWHPWFDRRGGEEIRVRVSSEDTVELRDDLIPTGRLVPVAGAADLRSGPSVVGRSLDNVYANVRSPILVGWPDLDLFMEFDRPVSTAVVFTPPEAVCAEPMTAWPDAIRLAQDGVAGTGLVVLDPGDRLVARTRWRWTSLVSR